MISKWMVTSLSSVLALSILIPTANAENLDKLEEKKQEAQQQQSELNSGINEKRGSSIRMLRNWNSLPVK
ncbi:hypothetical protein [Planococcus koreensis]|uniref:hypothetical protein n=1 Tax=Planococcus koreensis TaxID=112331 RepID=UPI0039FC4E62